MRFLVDTNLPPALANWLIEQGHEAVHTTALGLASEQDIEIWRHAASSGYRYIERRGFRASQSRECRRPQSCLDPNWKCGPPRIDTAAYHGLAFGDREAGRRLWYRRGPIGKRRVS